MKILVEHESVNAIGVDLEDEKFTFNAKLFGREPSETDKRLLWSILQGWKYVQTHKDAFADIGNQEFMMPNDLARFRHAHYFLIILCNDIENVLSMLTSFPEEGLLISEALSRLLKPKTGTLEMFKIAFHDLIQNCRDSIVKNHPYDPDQVVIESTV